MSQTETNTRCARMKKIGGNEFFSTLRGAKSAGKRRGYASGAKILDTEEGFCLLALGEGASQRSYNLLRHSSTIAEMRNGRWEEY